MADEEAVVALAFFLLGAGWKVFRSLATEDLAFAFDLAAVFVEAALGAEWLLLSAMGVCFEWTATTPEEGSMAAAGPVSTTLSLEATVLMDGQGVGSFRSVKVLGA